MISVVLWIPDSLAVELADGQAMIARSLPWLVSAVVAGVVRDLTLAASPKVDLARLAERVGCGLAEADRSAERLRAAVQGCREDRILVLRAGYSFAPGMIDELAHVSEEGDASRVLMRTARGWRERVWPNRHAVAGILAGRRQCLAAAGFDDLVRRYRRAPRLATRGEPLG